MFLLPTLRSESTESAADPVAAIGDNVGPRVYFLGAVESNAECVRLRFKQAS